MTVYKLLIKSARQVVQVCNNSERVLTGQRQKVLVILESDDAGYSLVVGLDGRILDIGEEMYIEEKYKNASFRSVLDARGKCVLPALGGDCCNCYSDFRGTCLVDAHTHPVWAGDRVHEFAMKLSGASYMDIHQAGGGIHFTVDHSRMATEDELFCSFMQRLGSMSRMGTTLVECKSGYGLDTENEVKLLKVIERGRQSATIDISVTFCGAHAVPRGWTALAATDDIISKQLPSIKSLMASGDIHVDNIDVFCEQGVFDINLSRKILEAGKDAGLQLNFHGDELHCLNSAEMGTEVGALAISHLEQISEVGIQEMSKSGTVAVILPTTAYILRLPNPPVRDMIASGVAVALGTDFNPNAYCLSMPMVMHLACINLHMSMSEALCASTINAAAALGMSSSHGSIEVGKIANVLVLNTDRLQIKCCRVGSNGPGSGMLSSSTGTRSLDSKEGI